MVRSGINCAIWLLSFHLLCIVDLDYVEAAVDGSLDSCQPCHLEVLDITYRHLLWIRELLAIRDSTRAVNIVWPSIYLSKGVKSETHDLLYR